MWIFFVFQIVNYFGWMIHHATNKNELGWRYNMIMIGITVIIWLLVEILSLLKKKGN